MNKYTLRMYEDLPGEQKVIIRRLFWHLQDTLPEGEFDNWFYGKGFYFDKWGRPTIGMFYDPPPTKQAQKESDHAKN